MLRFSSVINQIMHYECHANIIVRELSSADGVLVVACQYFEMVCSVGALHPETYDFSLGSSHMSKTNVFKQMDAANSR